MGLETGTYVNDLVVTNPATSDNVSQGDDHLRLIKSVLKNTLPNADKAFPMFLAETKTASYGVQATDEHMFFIGDGTSAAVTFTLPTLASGDDGWFALFQPLNLTNAVTIVPPTGTIDGKSSITFDVTNQLALLWWDGGNWHSAIWGHLELQNFTTLSAPATGDYLLIYDLSSTALRKIALSDFLTIVDALTALTAPDVADELQIYDASASAIRKITLANMFKVLNVFSTDTTPDLLNDFLLTYDASASANKKVTPMSISPFATQMLLVQQQRASGNDGDAIGTTFTTLTLNTVVQNGISGASLGSSQVSLPSGTYYIRVSVPIQNPNSTSRGVSIDVVNVTAGTEAFPGQTMFMQGNSCMNLIAEGIFAPSATRSISVKAKATGTGCLAGAASGVNTEVYTCLSIWKIG